VSLCDMLQFGALELRDEEHRFPARRLSPLAVETAKDPPHAGSPPSNQGAAASRALALLTQQRDKELGVRCSSQNLRCQRRWVAFCGPFPIPFPAQQTGTFLLSQHLNIEQRA